MPFIVDEKIEAYAEEHTSPDPDHLRAVADETREKTAAPQMMVGPLEGRFLELLAFSLQARRVLEIGTFTGYSAMSMAAGMPPDSEIITCELNPDHAEIARRHIESSPYRDRIDVRLGPALDTIAGLDGPFHLVFIDADKVNYKNYYEAVLPKLSEYGVIAVDNVLWSGNVLDETAADENTVALREFNDHVRNDDRVVCVMLTVRDGVMLIRRR